MTYLIILLVLGFLSYKLIDKHTHDIEINREKIKSDKVKSSINILHISDLHLNFDKKYQEKIIKYINSLNYDLIVLTGDYINGESYIINLDLFLRKIENTKRGYAVLGNNDHSYDLNRFKEIFNNNNFQLLVNESSNENIKDNEINIIGIDTPDLNTDDFNAAVKNINIKNDDSYNILLSHTYHIVNKNYDENIDLLLVGDTHGGQINIPFFNNILKSKFDFKYKSGKYSINNLKLFVNKGLGTNVIPIRFNCKPELLLITLCKD